MEDVSINTTLENEILEDVPSEGGGNSGYLRQVRKRFKNFHSHKFLLTLVSQFFQSMYEKNKKHI